MLHHLGMIHLAYAAGVRGTATIGHAATLHHGATVLHHLGMIHLAHAAGIGGTATMAHARVIHGAALAGRGGCPRLLGRTAGTSDKSHRERSEGSEAF